MLYVLYTYHSSSLVYPISKPLENLISLIDPVYPISKPLGSLISLIHLDIQSSISFISDTRFNSVIWEVEVKGITRKTLDRRYFRVRYIAVWEISPSAQCAMTNKDGYNISTDGIKEQDETQRSDTFHASH